MAELFERRPEQLVLGNEDVCILAVQSHFRAPLTQAILDLRSSPQSSGLYRDKRAGTDNFPVPFHTPIVGTTRQAHVSGAERNRTLLT